VQDQKKRVGLTKGTWRVWVMAVVLAGRQLGSLAPCWGALDLYSFDGVLREGALSMRMGVVLQRVPFLSPFLPTLPGLIITQSKNLSSASEVRSSLPMIVIIRGHYLSKNMRLPKMSIWAGKLATC